MNKFLQALPILAILVAVIALRIMRRRRPMDWRRLSSRKKIFPKDRFRR